MKLYVLKLSRYCNSKEQVEESIINAEKDIECYEDFSKLRKRLEELIHDCNNVIVEVPVEKDIIEYLSNTISLNKCGKIVGVVTR